MLRLTNKRREEASVKRALTLENEIELIEGCRAGKDSARKELYTLYSKQMLAVCYRYTGDMDAAHDVLHDGFIKIFTRFTFRGECALGTWVTRVMVTQAIDLSATETPFQPTGGKRRTTSRCAGRSEYCRKRKQAFRGSVDGVRGGTSRRLPYRVQLVCVRGEVAQGDCGTASYQGAFVYLAVAPCQVYVSEKN